MTLPRYPESEPWLLIRAEHRRRAARRRAWRIALGVWALALVVGFAPWPGLIP